MSRVNSLLPHDDNKQQESGATPSSRKRHMVHIDTDGAGGNYDELVQLAPPTTSSTATTHVMASRSSAPSSSASAATSSSSSSSSQHTPQMAASMNDEMTKSHKRKFSALSLNPVNTATAQDNSTNSNPHVIQIPTSTIQTTVPTITTNASNTNNPPPSFQSFSTKQSTVLSKLLHNPLPTTNLSTGQHITQSQFNVNNSSSSAGSTSSTPRPSHQVTPGQYHPFTITTTLSTPYGQPVTSGTSMLLNPTGTPHQTQHLNPSTISAMNASSLSSANLQQHPSAQSQHSQLSGFRQVTSNNSGKLLHPSVNMLSPQPGPSVNDSLLNLQSGSGHHSFNPANASYIISKPHLTGTPFPVLTPFVAGSNQQPVQQPLSSAFGTPRSVRSTSSSPQKKGSRPIISDSNNPVAPIQNFNSFLQTTIPPGSQGSRTNPILPHQLVRHPSNSFPANRSPLHTALPSSGTGNLAIPSIIDENRTISQQVPQMTSMNPLKPTPNAALSLGSGHTSLTSNAHTNPNPNFSFFTPNNNQSNNSTHLNDSISVTGPVLKSGSAAQQPLINTYNPVTQTRFVTAPTPTVYNKLNPNPPLHYMQHQQVHSQNAHLHLQQRYDLHTDFASSNVSQNDVNNGSATSIRPVTTTFTRHSRHQDGSLQYETNAALASFNNSSASSHGRTRSKTASSINTDLLPSTELQYNDDFGAELQAQPVVALTAAGRPLRTAAQHSAMSAKQRNPPGRQRKNQQAQVNTQPADPSLAPLFPDKMNPKNSAVQRVCYSCKTTTSVYWRDAWVDSRGFMLTLCNGCCLRFKKVLLACDNCLYIPYKSDLPVVGMPCKMCVGGALFDPQGKRIPATAYAALGRTSYMHIPYPDDDLSAAPLVTDLGVLAPGLTTHAAVQSQAHAQAEEAPTQPLQPQGHRVFTQLQQQQLQQQLQQQQLMPHQHLPGTYSTPHHSSQPPQ